MSADAAKGWSTIREFLADVYGPGVVEQVWLAGFQDIEAGPSWFGMQGFSRLQGRIGDAVGSSDLYFCSGLIRQGADNRTVGEVVAQPLLYADDIGTKVPRESWDAMFAMGFPEPTFRIETSPGNETWGWVLSGDATSAERWNDLALVRAYMIERGLTDALHDATRYLRLPWGHNSKPKYRGGDGKGTPPAVGFVDWKPGHKADLDQIGQVLIGGENWRQAEVPASAMTAAQLAASVGAGALNRCATMDDPVVQMAEVVGLEPKASNRAGVVDALCPNWQAHSDRADTGFAFLGGDLCHCNHASCEALRSPDFVAMIHQQYEDHVSALEAQGQRPADLPLSAHHFRAQKDFEQHGGLDPNAAVEVEREAEELAVRNERRAAQRAEEFDVALQRLTDRFVWVTSASAFYDLEDRRLVSREDLDYMSVVKDHIPPGTSGLKRACHQIRGHSANRDVAGVAYRPGGDLIVMDTTEEGKRLPHVNVWVASGVGRLKEHPKVWLELLEHVLPDAGYRDWFIKWLAHLFQKPGVRTPCFPLVIGGQGLGKDLMLVPVVNALGQHNVESVGMSRLEGNFTDWQRTALVILPELKLSADGKLYNQLKDWTGQNAGKVKINPKYGRTYSITPVCNFIAFSNHLDAVRGMEPDDRRIAAFRSPADPKDKAWYARAATVLYSMAEAERVHDFLMRVDLSQFNPHELPAASDKTKQAMLADNLSDKGSWVRDLFLPGGEFADRKYLTIHEIENHVVAEAPKHVAFGITAHAIRDALRSAGCESLGRVDSSRGRMSLWVGPGMDSAARLALKNMKPRHMLDAAHKDRDDYMKRKQAALLGDAV